MKTRGKNARLEKNPKRDFFNRQEPYSLERAMEPKRTGTYKYKQSIDMKEGGKYKKDKKF